MRSHAKLLLSLVCVGLVGCVPLPRTYLTAPQISGTVTNAGKPVAGVHVQLADVLDTSGGVADTAIQQDVVTDAQGHFSVGPIRRHAKSRPMPIFSIDSHTVPWGLRLSTDGQAWRPGWLSDPDLLGDVLNVPVLATCDLSADSQSSVIGSYESMVGNGPCKLTAKSKK